MFGGSKKSRTFASLSERKATTKQNGDGSSGG